MNIVVIGAGGIGAFYGMILHKVGCNIKFIARNKTLEYLKNNSMKVTHPNYTIEDTIDTYSLDEFTLNFQAEDIDAIFIATKAMSTENISKKLGSWINNSDKIPYYISLQNGVENEDIMEKYYPKDYVIGGLTRLVVSHTVGLGHVHCEGGVQTLLGALDPTSNNQIFLERLKVIFVDIPGFIRLSFSRSVIFKGKLFPYPKDDDPTSFIFPL